MRGTREAISYPRKLENIEAWQSARDVVARTIINHQSNEVPALGRISSKMIRSKPTEPLNPEPLNAHSSSVS